MSFNYFTFNGQRLEDLGFIIKKKPQYIIAEKDYTSEEIAGKDYTSEEIAGKDGNIIAYNGRYKNRTATYTIMSLPTRVHCSNRELVNKLNYWLNATTEYCKFTDTFNQGLYTEAFCSKVANVQDHMDGVIEAEVTFDMEPFWYIDSDIEVNNSPNGTEEFVLQNPTGFLSYPKITVEFVLQNPTGFLSYPKITVRVNLNANKLDFSFTDNNSNVQSFSIPPSPRFGDVEVVYDAKTGDVTIDGQPHNDLILNFNRPPVFSIGQNEITISHYHEHTIPYILIEPRWRML